jgi:hypothetical protein
MQIYISYSLFSPYMFFSVCIPARRFRWNGALLLPVLFRRPLSISLSLLVTTMTSSTKQSLAIDAKKFLVSHGF